jgi:Tfp pilus assembly protein PilX
MMHTYFKNQNSRGFTLFIAIMVTATLLLVAMGMISLAVRGAFITSSSRESQYAFYAADTGVECALYWDVKNPSGYSAFSTSTSSVINCNYDALNPSNQSLAVGSSQTSTFNLTFLPDPYCARVTVTKQNDGTTLIQSHGYNTCDPTNARRVERAVQVTY